jgi:glutaredoxin
MRVLALLAALAALATAIVVMAGEGDRGSLLLAAVQSALPRPPERGPTANPPPAASPERPAPAAVEPDAIPPHAPETAAEIELIRGGEVTVIEDTGGASATEPIPLYRYVDASGSIRMVEGLQTVPPEYRDTARRVSRGAGSVNQLAIPAPSRTAFRDWQPEFNPNRSAITLFSAPGCSACGRARAHLKRLGVAYELRDIERDRGAREEVRRILGRVVVPLLQVGSRYVSGYLPGEYDRAAGRSG